MVESTTKRETLLQGNQEESKDSHDQELQEEQLDLPLEVKQHPEVHGPRLEDSLED